MRRSFRTAPEKRKTRSSRILRWQWARARLKPGLRRGPTASRNTISSCALKKSWARPRVFRGAKPWRFTERQKGRGIRTFNLAMVGFGNVGKEFVRLLLAKRTELRDRYEIDWRITGIASRRIGWIADCNSLDPEALLAHQFPVFPAWKTPHSLHQWLATADPQVFFEASSLDWRSGQPATDHLKAALESGAHAISANKGPVVYAYRELRDLAKTKGRKFLFESTVMDGTPIFSMFPHSLPAVELRSFRGVLNATTNVVLTEMEKGLTLDQAVKRAQEIG